MRLKLFVTENTI